MKYPELKWVVLCMWRNKSYWEPIAAFNSESVARSYMDDCEYANSEFMTYKVEEINND